MVKKDIGFGIEIENRPESFIISNGDIETVFTRKGNIYNLTKLKEDKS